MSDYRTVRYDPTPIRCHPDKPGGECFRCGRFKAGSAPGGKTTSIDAMTLRKTPCPMWAARAVAA